MATEWNYSGRMERDEKQEDRSSTNMKAKKGKDTKHRKEGGEVTDNEGIAPGPHGASYK